MRKSTDIRLLWRKDINDQRWNNCINNAPNGLVYAQTIYLDALCDNWCAVIQGDYHAVLPLPWRSKWGVKYVYTPFFVPALSLFGGDEALQDATPFFQKAAAHFRYLRMDIDLQSIDDLSNQWQQQLRMNQVIAPGSAAYSRLARRKLQAAKQNRLIIEENIAPEIVIEAYQRTYRAQHKEVPATAYRQLLKACKALPVASLTTLAAHLPEEPFAGFYLLLHDEKAMHSILGGSTEKGKRAGAFYALTAYAIQLAATNNRTFRFEGSDVPGIYFFNKQFGAVDKPYVQLLYNNLPRVLRWIKR